MRTTKYFAAGRITNRITRGTHLRYDALMSREVLQ